MEGRKNISDVSQKSKPDFLKIKSGFVKSKLLRFLFLNYLKKVYFCFLNDKEIFPIDICILL